MGLRTLNNPFDVVTIMNILQQLLPVDPVTLLPNTQIGLNQVALGKSLIYVQQAYQMAQGPMPAILIEAGAQHRMLQGRAYRDADVIVSVGYFDRWDQNPSLIDAINANNSLDLERCAANIESNDALTFQNVNHAFSVPSMTLSGYKGSLDDKTVPGYEFIRHDLELAIHTLPYDT